jgi:hypothetical protein
VNSGAPLNARAEVCAALLDYGISGWSNNDLTRMSTEPGYDFADEPLEGVSAGA